jgi:hypothetical protein
LTIAKFQSNTEISAFNEMKNKEKVSENSAVRNVPAKGIPWRLVYT